MKYLIITLSVLLPACASKGALKRCVAEVKEPEVYLCEEQAQDAYRFCKAPKNIYKCEDVR
jgi:hypothetical protein